MKHLLPTRRLIPKWRRVATTLDMGEARTSSRGQGQQEPTDREALERAISEWKSNPTSGHLGDVLAFSVAEDCEEVVRDVAQEVLDRNRDSTNAQKILVHQLTSNNARKAADREGSYAICNPHVQKQVQHVRTILRQNPANPLVLLDFAQLQLTAGKTREAERSLRSALRLSPNSRIVLRTLARYYMHTEREDEAHALVSRHSRTPTDPWLMASEIAISQAAGVTARFADRGWKLTRDGVRHPQEISELAGALGGIELTAGRTKRARDLFRIALLQPNDNVLAQAITDQGILRLDLTGPIAKGGLGTAEGSTLLAWNSLDIQAAESNALEWHAEEPFSSRPMQFLATVLSVAGKYGEAEALARRGLIADPRAVTLYASLAYCLANQDKTSLAELASRRAMAMDSARYEPYCTATQGLIQMRLGHFERSDELYAMALEMFGRKGMLESQAVCYAYYARSAFDTNHPRVDEIIRSAADAYRTAKSQDAALVLRKLGSDIAVPDGDQAKRRLSQWIYDQERNVLIKRDEISAIGAPTLVIKPKGSR